MKRHSRQFLNISPEFSNFDTAAVAILPVAYEGGISFGKGAALGPKAVIGASGQLELYDEVLKAEPYRMGIVTMKPISGRKSASAIRNIVFRNARSLINCGKFVVGIGGDHSISIGIAEALAEKYSDISVIQLDAHADLREKYEDSPLSHACVMARIREFAPNTLQIGIRSLSVEEARRIENENLSVLTMADYRKPDNKLDAMLDSLPDPVYLSLDVDVFDWSVIQSTGTPEPGGFCWDEALVLLEKIFTRKEIIGFDVVELASRKSDINSSFAAAKLIYKMLGFKLAGKVKKEQLAWPNKPRGNIF